MEDNIKFCPECKGDIKQVDVEADRGNAIYYCDKCKNRFVIGGEY